MLYFIITWSWFWMFSWWKGLGSRLNLLFLTPTSRKTNKKYAFGNVSMAATFPGKPNLRAAGRKLMREYHPDLHLWTRSKGSRAVPGRSWNKMGSCLTKALADPTGSTGTKALWISQVLGVRVGRLDPTLTSHGVHADPRKSMAWVNWLLSADNVPVRSGELWASSSPSRVWRGIRVACYWPTASKSAFLASCLKPASARQIQACDVNCYKPNGVLIWLVSVWLVKSPYLLFADL